MARFDESRSRCVGSTTTNPELSLVLGGRSVSKGPKEGRSRVLFEIRKYLQEDLESMHGTSERSVDRTQRILVPLSPDERISTSALWMCADLMEPHHPIVNVLHLRVWDRVRGSRFFLETEEEANEIVNKAIQWFESLGLVSYGNVMESSRVDLAQSIVWWADSNSIDLIVVGSRPRRLVTKTLLGSTSYEIERLSSCPVIVVHPIC